LVPPFGTTDSLILIGLHDRPATVLCHPRKDEALILCGLIVAADPQVNACASASGVHGSASDEQETIP
jgi:hypothetical protein